MSDITLKLESKGIDINAILQSQEVAFQEAIKSLAYTTYDDLVQMANNNLYSSRQDYIKSLKFESFGNLYIISISEPGIHFENGFTGFDIKEGLLKSPKAKMSEKGYKYNIIPFLHRPTSKIENPKKADYYNELKDTVRNMVRIQPRPIRDRSGRIVGEVIAKDISTNKEKITSGMIKIRKDYGKSKQSTYLTFRGVSADPKSKSYEDWKHPGYSGLHGFESAEKILDSRIDDIIKVIFGV